MVMMVMVVLMVIVTRLDFHKSALSAVRVELCCKGHMLCCNTASRSFFCGNNTQ
jgi:hypothetical protein